MSVDIREGPPANCRVQRTKCRREENEKFITLYFLSMRVCLGTYVRVPLPIVGCRGPNVVEKKMRKTS
jgi:hypothetical protein